MFNTLLLAKQKHSGDRRISVKERVGMTMWSYEAAFAYD